MSSDNTEPKKALKEAGFTQPVLSFWPGRSVHQMLQGHVCINWLLSYNKGLEDQFFLNAVLNILKQKENLIFYGAGSLCRYFFELCPELSKLVHFIVDDDPLKLGQIIARKKIISINSLENNSHSIFIASTLYLQSTHMSKKAAKIMPSSNIISLNSLLKEMPLEHIPEKAYREHENTIYPIDIPEISFKQNLDFILLDVPPRFLCMMPNGLGSVHNILKKTSITFQTVDLDLIFYHRYHSHRILDGMKEIITTGGYVMQTDPWGVSTVEDEWSNPAAMSYFDNDFTEIIDKLVAAKPKILGFSLHATNLDLTKNIVTRIKLLLPEIVIVVGGYDCVNPELGPNLFSDFDYMVIFEAETSLGGLVEKLAAGEKPRNLPGIISKFDRPELPFIPAPLVQDLDSIDFPHYEWTDISLYKNYNGYQLTPIVLSRGCKWSKCTFCAERFDFRKRSATNVADEIEWLVSKGCSLFHFNDSDLSGDPQTVKTLCEEIIKRDIKGISLVGQLRVQKGYTLEYFEILYKAGFKNLRYGIDGWSKNALKLHKKGYTIQMIEEVLRYTKLAGIYVTINLVIGIPHETNADVDEAIENMIKNKGNFDAIENLNTLILSTGGLYREHPEKYGIKFRRKKEEIDKKFPKSVPESLWYSVDPYIDQDVRVNWLNKIVAAAQREGIGIGNYASWKVEKLQV